MVSQALTIDVLSNEFSSGPRTQRAAPPDLEHPYTRTGTRQAAAAPARNDPPAGAVHAFVWESFA